ncbi:DUF2027 domain-containing protein [Plebeiibacterium marinum]|uniref:DUF2027 domain-containing protein n=1 Tax=Plebeiibacterium marinum TaxID=2992111 RepID=A0AAE3MC58_9BACT|nr:DUF2027 domain-containing protein [Plebeiobacterium marinum]MCW3804874.1 DUF2027 domain-containing protein [Plebeiobacterium marinum]
MGLNIGDKVRFLNEVGGGVVSRVEGGKMVYVLDEDGFEVPALISDVVLVEKKIRDTEIIANEQDVENYHYEEEDEEGDPKFLVAFVRGKEAQGDVSMFLVNDSNFFAMYTLGEVTENGVKYKFSGQIEPNTKIELGGESISQIDGVKFVVQLLLFRKKVDYSYYNPVTKEFKVVGAKLLKDGGFVDNDYFEDRANLVYIVKGKLQEKIDELSGKEFHEVIKEKEVKPKKASVKRRDDKEMLEIDLHIDELLDDTRGMSNKEILGFQMERFHKVMEENKKNKNKKIVFIHGVGNGVLKNEIRKSLDRKYKWHSYQDASFKEYGFGATMVVI